MDSLEYHRSLPLLYKCNCENTAVNGSVVEEDVDSGYPTLELTIEETTRFNEADDETCCAILDKAVKDHGLTPPVFILRKYAKTEELQSANDPTSESIAV